MAPRKQSNNKAASAPQRSGPGREYDEDEARRGGADGEDESDGDNEDESGDGDDIQEDHSMVAEVIGDDDAIQVDDADLDHIIDESSPRRRAAADARLQLLKRDPLTAYIQETKRFKLLSREEEQELAVKVAEDGDAKAARRLIEANLRLVIKIAYEYRRAHRNLLDLIQEGNIGLMQAVRKYDPYRGVKLSSYAAWWIRAYILKFVLNNWRMVKIGTTQAQRKLFFNLRKEKERLEQLGFAPTTALLAENLDVTEKDVIEMEKRLAAPDASLDAPVTSDDDIGRTRMDLLPSAEGERPDRRFAQSEFQALLRGKLETFARTLQGREATIFQERWLTDSPLTLQQIGDRYGVSRERARQLEKRMLTRLRKFLEQELGTEVDIDQLTRE